jgi:hypothetical protein
LVLYISQRFWRLYISYFGALKAFDKPILQKLRLQDLNSLRKGGTEVGPAHIEPSRSSHNIWGTDIVFPNVFPNVFTMAIRCGRRIAWIYN